MENRTNIVTNDIIDAMIIESKNPTNSLSINIPFSFATNLVNLNWNDILFAIKNGYFDYGSAIDYAIIQSHNNNNCDNKIIDLACFLRSEITQEELLQQFVVIFASQISEKNKTETKDKIMYLLLSWLYENKDKFSDPLKVIEIIYDDFNFPNAIENLVRYKPIKKPTLIGTVQRQERFLNNWKEYLHSQKLKFGVI